MPLPSLPPTVAEVAAEVATAAQVAQERPIEHRGRSRAPGQALVDWLTNVTYWRLYEDAGCPAKLPAQGAVECRDAWIRIRTAVDLALQQQAPPAPAGAWVWPLQQLPRRWKGGGSFAARRPWKKSLPQTRYHCGTDLGAPAGTVVLAPEAGTVLSGDHGWESKKVGDQIVGVRAVVIRADSGRTVLLGGIRPGTGPAPGARVTAGTPVGTVGTYPLGDSMLHVQVWSEPLTLKQVIGRQSWSLGKSRPAGLTDPAPLLDPILAAAPMAIELPGPDENVEVDEGTPAGAPASVSVAQLLGAILGGQGLKVA